MISVTAVHNYNVLIDNLGVVTSVSGETTTFHCCVSGSLPLRFVAPVLVKTSVCFVIAMQHIWILKLILWYINRLQHAGWTVTVHKIACSHRVQGNVTGFVTLTQPIGLVILLLV